MSDKIHEKDFALFEDIVYNIMDAFCQATEPSAP